MPARLMLVPKEPGQIRRVLRGLAAIPARLTDTDLQQIGDSVRAGIWRTFENEGAAPRKWARLAPFTVKDRIEKGFPGEHPILFRTGSLEASWIERSHPLHNQFVKRTATGLELSVGSEDDRVPILTLGSLVMHMPPRPMHEISDADVERVAQRTESVVAYRAEQVGRSL